VAPARAEEEEEEEEEVEEGRESAVQRTGETKSGN
jgi:hypothetical protein